MAELTIGWILKWGSKVSGRGMGGTKAISAQEVRGSKGGGTCLTWAVRVEHSWRGKVGRKPGRGEASRLAGGDFKGLKCFARV